MYADYKFYSEVYHGNLTPYEYAPLAEKAGAYINAKTDFIFEEYGHPAEGSSLERRLMTCACVLADELNRIDTGSDRVKTSETVGDLSVSYSAEKVRSRDERLWDILQCYIPDVAKAVRWI